MSLELARRLSSVAPSATLAMAAEAAKLAAQGLKVYPFSVGEPDFPTPAHVVSAAKAALDAGTAFRYTAVTGTPDLKSAIVEATKRDRGHAVDPKQITVSCGAKHALFNVAAALYEPGDEVIIPAPYWVSYPEQVRLVGAEPVIAPTREADGFVLRPDDLERCISPRTKAIILCSPSNPTGAAYTEAQLGELAHVFDRGDYYVVVDEIYGDLVYGGFRHVSLAAIAPSLRDRLIVIDGVSKSYAMTGWRIGWSISPPNVAGAISTIQSQSTTNPAAVAQAAAAAALRGPRDSVLAMRAAFERRRAVMVEGLNRIPGVRCRMPEGAFYAFADVSGLFGLRDGDRVLDTDEAVAMWLLREARVATVAGAPFGAPGYLRLSYACSEADISAGLDAIAAAVLRASK
jgi:aspartate aminotransferase